MSISDSSSRLEHNKSQGFSFLTARQTPPETSRQLKAATKRTQSFYLDHSGELSVMGEMYLRAWAVVSLLKAAPGSVSRKLVGNLSITFSMSCCCAR